AGSTGLLFRRRDSRLGSVHNRSEFIKNWYESVRPRFLLRSSLLGSYGDARRLDVTRVTGFSFWRAQAELWCLALSGVRRYISANFPKPQRRRRSTTRRQGAHGPSTP